MFKFLKKVLIGANDYVALKIIYYQEICNSKFKTFVALFSFTLPLVIITIIGILSVPYPFIKPFILLIAAISIGYILYETLILDDTRFIVFGTLRRLLIKLNGGNKTSVMNMYNNLQPGELIDTISIVLVQKIIIDDWYKNNNGINDKTLDRFYEENDSALCALTAIIAYDPSMEKKLYEYGKTRMKELNDKLFTWEHGND